MVKSGEGRGEHREAPPEVKKTHYGVLGVRHDATPEDIRAAYTLLSKVYHPDLNPEHKNSGKFSEIFTAYKVLSNPHDRTRYNEDLWYDPTGPRVDQDDHEAGRLHDEARARILERERKVRERKEHETKARIAREAAAKAKEDMREAARAKPAAAAAEPEPVPDKTVAAEEEPKINPEAWLAELAAKLEVTFREGADFKEALREVQDDYRAKFQHLPQAERQVMTARVRAIIAFESLKAAMGWLETWRSHFAEFLRLSVDDGDVEQAVSTARSRLMRHLKYVGDEHGADQIDKFENFVKSEVSKLKEYRFDGWFDRWLEDFRGNYAQQLRTAGSLKYFLPEQQRILEARLKNIAPGKRKSYRDRLEAVMQEERSKRLRS